MAYRGRVLVEVGMTLGQSPKMKTDDISTFDLDRLSPFLRRRKYKLFGAFFSANMVYPGNHPVQFEVSIGDYGNKQDDKSPIQSSTTPPSNPVYDGTKYYYLPWQKEKPVIEVRPICYVSICNQAFYYVAYSCTFVIIYPLLSGYIQFIQI